jgi:hypothetical protein
VDDVYLPLSALARTADEAAVVLADLVRRFRDAI